MQEEFICPPLDGALISFLESLYPDCSPNLRWTDREVWFKAGQASVVQFLRAKYEEQKENILTRR